MLISPIPSATPSEGQKLQMARKFGAFIHFGVNTFGNTEWSDGGIDALSYQPDYIDADGWIRAVRDAGMNYIVMITKHHDGFCLWNTKYTDYCVKNSGNKTDVIAAVSEACEKYGIKLGLYYSLWDRREASYKNDFDNGYINYMLNQLTELFDGRYGEIVELWLDGMWDKPIVKWQLPVIYDHIKRMQPLCQIGVNHTIGDDTDGFPDEKYQPQNYIQGQNIRAFPSDFRLWDPYMCRKDDPKLYSHNGKLYYMPFEMTVCMREGFSWFYSNIYEKKPLTDKNKTAQNCRTLFSSGNCALINLPPDTSGRLVGSDVKHLMEIAEKIHSD